VSGENYAKPVPRGNPDPTDESGMSEAQAQVREHRLERAGREWLVTRIEVLVAERDALRDAAERAIVIAERTDIKPVGRLGAVHATLRLALRKRPE
jgi:hypothetical protein